MYRCEDRVLRRVLSLALHVALLAERLAETDGRQAETGSASLAWASPKTSNTNPAVEEDRDGGAPRQEGQGAFARNFFDPRACFQTSTLNRRQFGVGGWGFGVRVEVVGFRVWD